MNKAHFSDGTHMVQKCRRAIDADHNRSEDRASILRFYNGEPTKTEEEAEKAGQTEIVNHLFGYDSMRGASEQIESIYSKDRNLVVIEVEEGKEQAIEGMALTRAFNKVLKKSGRMKPHWKAFAGYLTLLGSAHWLFHDKTDWCPECMNPFVPDDSGIVPDDMEFWATRNRLSLRELQNRLEHAKIEGSWNKRGLNEAINSLTGGTLDADGHRIWSTPSDETPEDNTIRAQSQPGGGSDFYELSIPVFHVYQPVVRNGKFGIDMTVVADLSNEYTGFWTAKGRSPEVVLGDFEHHFACSNECFVPVFLDCLLGGVTKFHRTMGLGRLNYPADFDVEEKFNRIMEGAASAAKEFIQTEEHSDLARLERYAGTGVLPPGVKFAIRTTPPNYQNLLAPINMLRQNSSLNAAGTISNDAHKGRELEVQAMQRVQRASQSIGHRMNEVYERIDILAEAMVKRMFAKGIQEQEPGWRDIQLARKKAITYGIKGESRLNKLLECDEFGEFKHISVKVSRHAGDGSNITQSMMRRTLLQFMGEFGPEARRELLRQIIIYEGNNPDLANRLLPEAQPIDSDQLARANTENYAAMTRGVTGFVPPVADDDLHQYHAPEHLSALHAAILAGQQGRWGQIEAAGFQSLAQHTEAHIQAMSRMTGVPQAEEFSGALRQLSTMAQQLSAQHQQQQAQAGPEAQRAAMEQAKLQLKDQVRQDVQQRSALKADLEERKAIADASIKDAKLIEERRRTDIQERRTKLQEDSAKEGKPTDPAP